MSAHGYLGDRSSSDDLDRNNVEKKKRSLPHFARTPPQRVLNSSPTSSSNSESDPEKQDTPPRAKKDLSTVNNCAPPDYCGPSTKVPKTFNQNVSDPERVSKIN